MFEYFRDILIIDYIICIWMCNWVIFMEGIKRDAIYNNYWIMFFIGSLHLFYEFQNK